MSDVTIEDPDLIRLAEFENWDRMAVFFDEV
jgi:hypothetical protein